MVDFLIDSSRNPTGISDYIGLGTEKLSELSDIEKSTIEMVQGLLDTETYIEVEEHDVGRKLEKFDYLLFLVGTYYQKGNFEKASEFLNQMNDLEMLDKGDKSNIYWLMATCDAAMMDLDSALSNLDKILELYPGSPHIVNAKNELLEYQSKVS